MPTVAKPKYQTPPHIEPLRAILERLPKGRCWHGAASGRGCRSKATHKNTGKRDAFGHSNELLVDAVWCRKHAHAGDVPLEGA
jgi:hypothetical protein